MSVDLCRAGGGPEYMAKLSKQNAEVAAAEAAGKLEAARAAVAAFRAFKALETAPVEEIDKDDFVALQAAADAWHARYTQLFRRANLALTAAEDAVVAAEDAAEVAAATT